MSPNATAHLPKHTGPPLSGAVDTGRRAAPPGRGADAPSPASGASGAACVWCGSRRLLPVARGTRSVRLTRCTRCAHTFGAPRPATALRPPAPRAVPERRHRERARLLLPYGEPESWLDVGTGEGAFPAVARSCFPYTAFDGLDPDPVQIARARAEGHVEEAHHGTLSSALPALVGRYDVVSLFHQLERAPDPRAELAAAAQALRTGGYLLVEAYDPRSALGTLLGPHWAPFTGQTPAHLVPRPGLLRALRELGFTVLSVRRGPAHLPGDLRTAAARALAHRRGPAALLTRPLTGTAGALDALLAPLARRTRLGTGYRVLARRG
ncbi:class I SAM-dependent methyltransferase [Streptomyces sp. NPDC007088]|uniref:class I SAM-dependent methyltransferase n=1 Tax=Streptomyces sp. NPDC007088 TaxID=3364773 RepID=UPI0036A06B12